MSNPSNLYAEKVYAEHPIALWALDDSATYISFITESNRNVNTWTKTNCTTGTYTSTDYPFSPFSDSATTQVFFNGTGSTLRLTSTATFNPNGTENFNIAFHLYSFSTRVSGIRVGYQQGSSAAVLNTVNLKMDDNDPTKIYDRFWHFISERFTSINASIKIVVEVDFATVATENSILINGVTAGANAEEFNGESLGVAKETLPTTIYPYPTYTYGVSALAYGSSSNNGYYLVSNNQLHSKNSSIPMVYGSSSSTTLEPIDEMCLVLPGMGFLNDYGKYRELSFETWLRVIGKPTTAKRIIGPVASTDGLYIDESFLVLKIGDNFESHYVGEWDRPMLININTYSSGANVLINGNEVISMQFDLIDIDFPNKTVSSKDADWIAFYSYTDSKIHVDCVAVYPYIVDTVLAKKRFVYAQGVEFPEQLNKAYYGDSFVTDYAYSKFGNNYNYPDAGKWEMGTSDSISSVDNTLKPIVYEKPSVSIVGNTEDSWLSATYASNVSYATFNSTYSGYLLFDKQSYFNQFTRAVYGVFNKSSTSKLTEQTLIKIQDRINGDYLKATLSGEVISGTPAYKVTYSFKRSGVDEEILHTSTTFAAGTNFAAGFDLKTLSDIGSSDLNSFLASTNNLIVYVANSEDYSTGLFGRIYSVGFTSSKGWSKVSSYFDGLTGLIKDTAVANSLYDINTTYSLKFSSRLSIEKVDMDVYSSGYWYDGIPLKLLAKTVNSETPGQTEYALDYIQIDLDATLPAISGSSFSTSDSSVRTYVHFQSSTLETIPSNLTDIAAPSTKVITPSISWETERYEIVTGSIVKIPATASLSDTIVVVTIETNVDGIYYKPLFIRYLHIAGRSLNKLGDNLISSKNGKSVYPYEVVDDTVKYSTVSPISIYKQSMPYFYATGNTGIEVTGTYSDSVDRGFLLKLNENNASFFRLASMQVYIRYGLEAFPETAQKLFEMTDGSSTITIRFESINSLNTKARIYAEKTVGGTTSDYHDIKFFLNGLLVDEPVISINEWSAIGISLLSTLNLDGQPGDIRFNGNFLFNNISYYQAPEIELNQQIVFRIWNDVSVETWSTWSAGTWTDMLITTATPTIFGISPQLVYKSFTGTDRIIADSDVSNTKLLLNKYQYKLFNNYSTDIKLLTAR
jgi:hypothetical protein